MPLFLFWLASSLVHLIPLPANLEVYLSSCQTAVKSDLDMLGGWL